MHFKDLPHFIEVLTKKNLLTIIGTEVDPELEITEITDRVSKSYGKALLFTNVKGSPYPLIINTFGTYERLHLGLGVDNLDDIASEIENYMNLSMYVSIMDKIKAIPKLAPLPFIFPKKVKHAPCQEVIEDADLSTLPILKCWPDDGGKYITLPLVFTIDPDNGQQNVGMYRLQVYDKNTTGMHWHLHKDGKEIYEKYRKLGKKMPVCVALGCDPATIYAATAPLPKMIDEMIFAGYLRKKGVSLVKSITSEIYVPAHAEFILEGYVDMDERRLEGPFGDHTGYYSLADEYPVFHVEKITRKKNPIYPTTIVGKPPMEDCYLGKATERIFLPLMKLQCPELMDMDFPLEGVFHNCAIVSIKKAFPLHGNKVLNALWGLGQMMYTKMIIIVDASVNVHNYTDVLETIMTHVTAPSHLVISEGPLDALDHASNRAFQGFRLGIDATKKLAVEHNGPVLEKRLVDYSLTSILNMLSNEGISTESMSTETISIVNKPTENMSTVTMPTETMPTENISIDTNKHILHAEEVAPLSESAIKILPVTITDIARVSELVDTYLDSPVRFLVLIDAHISPGDLSTVSWKIFNNIDPSRDMVVKLKEDGSLFVMINATKKGPKDGLLRPWPDDIEMSKEMIEYVTARWDSYGI
ncbi:MAG: menaquinone biosynthesis decarboxylase [Vallitaleaceae bacterium]|nr:menaquinone biosynthesis decarboxylase [Vallitaleaceae bacterium]